MIENREELSLNSSWQKNLTVRNSIKDNVVADGSYHSSYA